MQFSGIYSLQPNRHLPILNRRLPGPPFHDGMIENMRTVKRCRAVLSEFDGTGGQRQQDFRGVSVRPPRRVRMLS